MGKILRLIVEKTTAQADSFLTLWCEIGKVHPGTSVAINVRSESGCVITWRGGLSSIAPHKSVTRPQAVIAANFCLMPTMFMARVRL